MSEPTHVISLGAGVQSSAMALMACHGKIKPMPSCAIFADTGDEPYEVYAWLRVLVRHLTFPVIQLRGPKLSDGIVNQWGHSQIPDFVAVKGKPTIGKRQCTRHFKIQPIRHEIRERFPNQNVVLWQGISTDEVSRCKDSGRNWLLHRFPLIELGLNRQECQNYLEKNIGEAPKSACVYCPYRSRSQWRKSVRDPRDSEIIRKVESVLNPRGEYLVKEMKSVFEVDLSTEEERGQLNMFENECEGMCGV